MLGGRNGISLPELAVALVLAGVFSTALVRMSVSALRYGRLHAERSFMGANLETAAALLEAELSELSVGESGLGDIYSLTDTAITYRAQRGVSFVCRLPQPGTALVVLEADWHGLRALDAARDSLLVYRGPDWLPMDAATSSGGRCADGRPGISVRLGASQSHLEALEVGVPVRAFEVVTLRLYSDRDASYWLGVRQWNKRSGWASTQPVLGPLAAEGLRFEALDAWGQPVTSAGHLVRVTVTVQSRAPLLRRGSSAHLRDSLSVVIALRNSPR